MERQYYKRADMGGRCMVCGEPMVAELVRREPQWRVHPACHIRGRGKQ